MTSLKNNHNSNNFILGVDPKKNNIMTPSESLIDHLRRIEKESNNTIKNNENVLTKKSLNNVVNELITKLEKDVYTLNNQIKNYNAEKKAIIELNDKEIDRLKDIIVKMYLLVITINKSIELKHNNRTVLLEKLRKTLQSNKGLLSNIDEIMSDKYKKMNDTYANRKDKISNIINHVEQIPEKKNTSNVNQSSANQSSVNQSNVNQSSVNQSSVNQSNVNQSSTNQSNISSSNTFYTNLKNNEKNNEKRRNNRQGLNNKQQVNNEEHNEEHNDEHNDEHNEEHDEEHNDEHNEEESSNKSVNFRKMNNNISSTQRYSSINPNVNLHQENEKMNSKKNKKIENKINSLKMNQTNAKQSLNKYILTI